MVEGGKKKNERSRANPYSIARGNGKARSVMKKRKKGGRHPYICLRKKRRASNEVVPFSRRGTWLKLHNRGRRVCRDFDRLGQKKRDAHSTRSTRHLIESELASTQESKGRGKHCAPACAKREKKGSIGCSPKTTLSKAKGEKRKGERRMRPFVPRRRKKNAPLIPAPQGGAERDWIHGGEEEKKKKEKPALLSPTLSRSRKKRVSRALTRRST